MTCAVPACRRPRMDPYLAVCESHLRRLMAAFAPLDSARSAPAIPPRRSLPRAAEPA